MERWATEGAWGTAWLLGGKDPLWGKHRTEVTEGMERWVTEGAWGTAWLLGGKDPLWGKHRTEATEVTEGGLRVGRRKHFGGQLDFWAGKTRFGKSIAQRPRRSQRGWRAGLRKAFWWTAWSRGGKDASLYQMPPRAWRPGLEPAELSFRVPHFLHQTRRDSRGRRISIMITSLAIKN
jgi:hypothetical protein